MSSAHADPKDFVKGIRGRVVHVRDPSMVDDGGQPLIEVVQKWITAALENLTSFRGADAWRCLFRPDDRIAIKVNTLGGPEIATSPQIAMAVALELGNAGIPLEQIVIWDRRTSELEKAGYPIREKGGGPLIFGTDRFGYERFPRMHGSIGSCFSPILTRWATALIDIPIMKDHDLSGVSLSIKNLFGVIHNPNKYHDSGCDPYLADLLGCPEIHSRLRLIVCDAHQAQCHGGPAFVPQWAWPYHGLLVGVDPVATDRIGAEILEDRRSELGLPSLTEAKRPPVHIDTACKRGLGEGNIQSVEVHELG